MENTKLQWHPAFSAALRITLREEMKFLEMHEEFPLSRKPPQIDVLIIKKLRTVTIHKAIGRIFRTNLKAGGEIREIVARYEKNRHSKDYSAVMNLITRANWKEMEVERKMCDALKELFAEELKEENEKGMELGMERGKAEGIRLAKLVFKLSLQGDSAEEIAGKCGVSLEQVQEILN